MFIYHAVRHSCLLINDKWKYQSSTNLNRVFHTDEKITGTKTKRQRLGATAWESEIDQLASLIKLHES